MEGPDGRKALRQEPFKTLPELHVKLSRTSAAGLEAALEKESAAADERRRHMF